MDISKVRKRLKELKAEKGRGDSPGETERVEKKECIEKEEKTAEVNEVRAESERTGPVISPPSDEGIEIERELDSASEIELIAFKISNEEYAVRLIEMQEIINYRKVTRVPRTPPYLKGVTFLRGKILPVIDLKERLEISGNGEESKKIIILSTSKGEPIGAIVSSFIRVLRFPEREMLPPPTTLSEKEKRFIKGVFKMNDRFISILNIEELIKMEA
ncbi:MAG: hypothetical protein Fur0020_04130 [Thermodesulfovibrionia bacterium]